MKQRTLEEVLTEAQERGACSSEAIRWFRSAERGDIDEEAFNLSWLLWAKDHNILPDGLIPALAKCEQAIAIASAEYRRTAIPAWAEHKRVTDSTRAEYTRARELAITKLLKAVSEYIKPV